MLIAQSAGYAFVNSGTQFPAPFSASPSMTTVTFGRQLEIDFANAENEANGCPLREIS